MNRFSNQAKRASSFYPIFYQRALLIKIGHGF
nr:MAG TPA: hypothetical protein [Caudoviricetes sp.]